MLGAAAGRELAGALTADDQSARAATAAAAPPPSRRAGCRRSARSPTHASVRFLTVAVDLGQRAVATAGVVAGVGRPRVGERLVGSPPGSRRRPAPALRCAGASSTGRQRAATAVRTVFCSVISVSPDRQSRRGCPCRCRPAAACLCALERIADLDLRRRRRRGGSCDGMPSASRRTTMKSSMRTSRPSTFCRRASSRQPSPVGDGRTRPPRAAPRPRPPPPETQYSAAPAGPRTARPAPLQVTGGRMARCRTSQRNSACPAAASPTSDVELDRWSGGGSPCPRIVAATLWM